MIAQKQKQISNSSVLQSLIKVTETHYEYCEWFLQKYAQECKVKLGKSLFGLNKNVI